MQNLILLAVIVVGFFYALYRTYKNSDGSGEGAAASGCCSSCPMAAAVASLPVISFTRRVMMERSWSRVTGLV